MRVAVVGNGGSGKTWLALRLAEALHVPVVHLDLYRYDASGVMRSDEQFHREVRDRLEGSPDWVADGNYLSTLAERLARADAVVFLDVPALICLAGVLARRFRRRGRRTEDDSHLDRFDLEFARYVAMYPSRMRPRMVAALSASEVPVTTLHTRREARVFADRVGALGRIPT